MMKRPLSPPSVLLPTTASGPSPSRSRLSSLRQQASRFQLSPMARSASARTVCLLLGALCLVFFLAEMKENNGITSSPASGIPEPGAPAKDEGGGGGGGGGGAQAGEPGADASEPLPGGLPGGLRRFANFEDYVVRAQRAACLRGRKDDAMPALARVRMFSLFLFHHTSANTRLRALGRSL